MSAYVTHASRRRNVLNGSEDANAARHLAERREQDLRSADHRWRHQRRWHRARRDAARTHGAARREGRLRGGHELEVLEAYPWRAALPAAGRVRAGLRVGERADDAAQAGRPPGATARVSGAGLSRA